MGAGVGGGSEGPEMTEWGTHNRMAVTEQINKTCESQSLLYLPHPPTVIKFAVVISQMSAW